MFTPYDWQEGIGNRAQYIEGKLAHGAAVLAVSLDSGILVFTYRRQAQKIFEIYDRLIFGALGQQSDIESIRLAALEFATREGFERSDQDVTIQRVIMALSAPMKRSFADFGGAPIVARSLFAEVHDTPGEDRYYMLDYDGDYSVSRNCACAVGDSGVAQEVMNRLAEVKSSLTPESALEQLEVLWSESMRGDADSEVAPAEGLNPEAVLLERASGKENRFRVLVREEV